MKQMAEDRKYYLFKSYLLLFFVTVCYNILASFHHYQFHPIITVRCGKFEIQG